MSVRFKDLLLFTAMAAPAAVAFAQTGTAAKPAVPQAATAAQPRPAAAQPAAPQATAAQPGAQLGVPQPVTMPAQEPAPPPPPPPPVWTMADANQLLLAILNSAREGLDPADYDAAGLMTAMRSNDPVLL